MLVKLKKNKLMSAMIDCTSIWEIGALAVVADRINAIHDYYINACFHMDRIIFNQ